MSDKPIIKGEKHVFFHALLLKEISPTKASGTINKNSYLTLGDVYGEITRAIAGTEKLIKEKYKEIVLITLSPKVSIKKLEGNITDVCVRVAINYATLEGVNTVEEFVFYQFDDVTFRNMTSVQGMGALQTYVIRYALASLFRIYDGQEMEDLVSEEDSKKSNIVTVKEKGIAEKWAAASSKAKYA